MDAKAVARETTLALAALVGVMTVLGFLASLAFGVTFEVFATGSMSPTIPTGALAITRPAPASDLRVGQVVTVPFPGRTLPITHRIVKIADDPGVPAGRVLTLKGDANATADAVSYHVSTAKVLLWSTPGIGTIWTVMHTPLFLGLGTLLLVTLVLWAFWPRSVRPRHA